MAASSTTSTRYQLGLLLTNLIFSVVLNYAHARGHHPGRQQRFHQSRLHGSIPEAIDRHQFISEHNAVRAQFHEQPLTWNSTLARYAKRFALQRVGDCEMVHSNGPFGENVFWGSNYESYSASTAVQSWAGETSNYNSQINSCAVGQMCGHYTQIVWTTTTRLGCARVKCNSGGVYAICVYDPPGNFVGENPFADLSSQLAKQYEGVKLAKDKLSGTMSSQMPVFTVNNKKPQASSSPLNNAPAPAPQA
ncbi:hypothetical protein MKW94_005660 [Papaver nudicaule]|uniref:SCP domain-containing protein n=1 Tax=Papaver nudicaule TaxID=74823 RepID=A0AA41UZI1_PAPNU|nr:hypothetical protein [Papaver nudicaule]